MLAASELPLQSEQCSEASFSLRAELYKKGFAALVFVHYHLPFVTFPIGWDARPLLLWLRNPPSLNFFASAYFGVFPQDTVSCVAGCLRIVVCQELEI